MIVIRTWQNYSAVTRKTATTNRDDKTANNNININVITNIVVMVYHCTTTNGEWYGCSIRSSIPEQSSSIRSLEIAGRTDKLRYYSLHHTKW